MKIKHYKAPDMRTALRQVKDAQGQDAVILSSRRIAVGVEVVAAVDYDGEEAMTEQLAQSAAPVADTRRYATAEDRTQQGGRNVSYGGASQLSGFSEQARDDLSHLDVADANSDVNEELR